MVKSASRRIASGERGQVIYTVESVFILQLFCQEALCHKIRLENFHEILAYQHLTL